MRFNNPVMTYLNIDKSLRFLCNEMKVANVEGTAYFIGGNQNEIRGG